MQCSYPSCSKKLSPTLDANVSCPYCRTYLYCTPTCRQLHWDISHKVSCTGYQSSTTAAVMSTSALDSSTAGSESSKKKQKNLEDFEVINQPNKSNADLGKGSFGQVKLVRDKADPSKQYAMKVINKKQLMTHSGIDYLKREIKIQKKLDHPHIVKLYHYFEDKDNVYLVLEYAKNGNLFFYLRRKKTLTEKEAFIYFFQTCVGIDYLHKKGILHRDLKPENLLLDANGNIKVCDFGWSAEDVGKRNTFCGTVDYMAPEMVQNKAHDFKIDIWSLGVLLFELLHGYPPFRGKTANEKFQSILEKELKFKDGLSNEARDLISSLLRSDPAGRPGFDFIFDHAWTRKNEKEFGMSVKSFIYDPSKKKEKEKDKDANKSGNTTPRSHSPIPQSISSTPKDISLSKPLTPTNIGGGLPLSIDVNFSNPTTPQHSAYSPKMDYKPLSTSPLNAASTNISSLNQPTTPQYSAYSPKADYKPLSTSPLNTASNNPSSINQLPLSPARSRNNLDDPFSQTGATTPTKGPNKAQELVQSIFEPPKERSKSPSRSGIFSPHRQYEGPQQVSTAFVDDMMQKRKTTNENPISTLPGTDFEASKRKTTHDISVTGQPERSNRFSPESYLPSSMNNISSPYNAKDTGISGMSPLPRTNSDNSLAVKPANVNVIPSPSAANAHSKSPSRDFIEFNKTVQASKVDPNLIKKTLDDDVPDIKESTKKDNFNFGHNIPKVQNINVQIPETSFKPLSSTPTTSNADLHKSPRADYSQPYTPTTTVEKSHTTQTYGGGYLDNSYQTTKVTTPTGSGEKAGYKDTGFKHPDIHNLMSSSSSNVVSSTYGQQPQHSGINTSSSSPFTEEKKNISKSPGRPYETKEPEVQKPVQREVKEQSMGKPTSSQQQSQNFSSSQTYYADNSKPKQETYAKEGDFFVPKNENIESMFNKNDNYGWSNQNQNQMQSGGHNFESEPARFTRVTSLLEKGHLSEVDQIMEKLQNESQDNNGRRTQNERQGNQRREKSPHAEHGTEFRVTNIDKYLASYDLEGTEENQILDMLDTYYTTGKLENDDGRYPKKKAPENIKEQKNKMEESFGEMSFQADGPQAKKLRNEMSFQEENSQRFDDRKQFRSEMSFADNPPDTEESPLNEKMSRGQKLQNQKAPHHIQEENEHDEEDDYYDRKARDKRGAEPATQKDSPRRKAAPVYNHQEDEEEEEQQYYRNQNRGKENDKKQEIRTEKRGGITFEEEEEELDRRIQQKQKDKHMRTHSEQDNQYRGQAPEQPRKQGQDRGANANAANYENKINEEAGSFIVRMVNKEKSEPTHNRANNKSYDSNAQNSSKRTNPQQYDSANLENQREDLMKRYRDRLNGLYGLNSGMPENQQQQQQQYGYDNGNNYQTNQKNRGNVYEQEEEEESPGFGRRENERKAKKESKYDQDAQYNKSRRRKDDWPEEYEKEERHAEEQLDYYKNKLVATNHKSMTESYEDMKKRTQRLTYFMDDLDVEDSRTVSRPSWKNIKEIPKYQEQANTETGLFGKITSLFTCLDRTDKNPPQKTRKGRKVY